MKPIKVLLLLVCLCIGMIACQTATYTPAPTNTPNATNATYTPMPNATNITDGSSSDDLLFGGSSSDDDESTSPSDSASTNTATDEPVSHTHRSETNNTAFMIGIGLIMGLVIVLLAFFLVKIK